MTSRLRGICTSSTVRQVVQKAMMMSRVGKIAALLLSSLPIALCPLLSRAARRRPTRSALCCGARRGSDSHGALKVKSFVPHNGLLLRGVVCDDENGAPITFLFASVLV